MLFLGPVTRLAAPLPPLCRLVGARAHSSAPSSAAAWRPPAAARDVGIRVVNPLAGGAKVPLLVPTAGPLTWYTCGPTVYDDAHLGHARSYVHVDIVQRILREHFRLPLHHVLGMTDFDDKILARWVEGQALHSSAGVDSVGGSSGSSSGSSSVSSSSSSSVNSSSSSSVNSSDGATSPGRPAYLGSPSTLAQHFERAFHADMRALGVRPPDEVRRVTEHMDWIVRLVERIVAEGLAYVARDGSVYFDSGAYEAQGRSAPLLRPQIATDDEDDAFGHKKRLSDFALWKAVTSPDGAHSWASPWGNGRPGWHIECSAMCHASCGPELWIHSGGVDLAFPHHQNEILQCAAASPRGSSQQWPYYFLHTGHIHIEGRKMSKSLKNFITIREFLASNDPLIFRVFCLLHHYAAPIDFSASQINTAATLMHKLAELQREIRACIASTAASLPPRHGDAEQPLRAALDRFTERTDRALRDDFDTPAVFDELMTLRSATHSYIGRVAPASHSPLALAAVHDAVAQVLHLFGLDAVSNVSSAAAQTTGQHSSSDATAAAAPTAATAAALDLLAEFRSTVRQTARSAGSKPLPPAMGALLAECDALRTRVYDGLGVRLLDDAVSGRRWAPAAPRGAGK